MQFDKVTVVKPVHPLLDQEAIRLIKSLPKWTPGEQRGKPVNVWWTVLVKFQLQVSSKNSKVQGAIKIKTGVYYCK